MRAAFAAATALQPCRAYAGHLSLRQAARCRQVSAAFQRRRAVVAASADGPTPAPDTATHKYKRLVVLADGTWQEPTQSVGTNVLKLATAIKLEGDDGGRQQIVHYTAGLGTGVLGGGIGAGIDQAIKELYFFLASNYDVGDEIYMFGFSRGAYTVRSLAGMIRVVGILRRRHLDKVDDAYKVYRKGGDIGRGEDFIKKYCQRPKPHEKGEAAEMEEHPTITCIGVWDTVGSLGLPFNVVGPLDNTEFSADNYKFINTQISKFCLNGIHLMSIDEDRKTFGVTTMDESMHLKPERKGKQVTQLYLPGTHGGVGGGGKKDLNTSQYSLWKMYTELQLRCPQLSIEYDLLEIYSEYDDLKEETYVSKKIEADNHPEILGLQAKFVEPDSPTLRGMFISLFGREARKIHHLDQVDAKAVKVRYENLIPHWRPKSLELIEKDIEAMDMPLHTK